jgi:hypothetical protein
MDDLAHLRSRAERAEGQRNLLLVLCVVLAGMLFNEYFASAQLGSPFDP